LGHGGSKAGAVLKKNNQLESSLGFDYLDKLIRNGSEVTE